MHFYTITVFNTYVDRRTMYVGEKLETCKQIAEENISDLHEYLYKNLVIEKYQTGFVYRECSTVEALYRWENGSWKEVTAAALNYSLRNFALG